MLNTLLWRFVRKKQDNPITSDLPEIHVDALKQRWDRDGYLMLERAIEPAICDGILDELKRYTGPERWTLNSAITMDVLHGRLCGRRLRLRAAPDDAFDGPFKVNNLFAESQTVQSAVFTPYLRQVLRVLLDDEPMAFNSLNFKYGSQQPDHIDSWYMPPPIPNSMAVASICLEDTDPEAGPVMYYPGSHKIPPYVFSHGRIDAVESEMPGCRRHLDEHIGRMGLKKEAVLGKKGDIFIWHCQLLHGGSPIIDPSKTRASLVVHYWGARCVSPSRVRIGANGGSMLNIDYHWSNDATIADAI